MPPPSSQRDYPSVSAFACPSDRHLHGRGVATPALAPTTQRYATRNPPFATGRAVAGNSAAPQSFKVGCTPSFSFLSPSSSRSAPPLAAPACVLRLSLPPSPSLGPVSLGSPPLVPSLTCLLVPLVPLSLCLSGLAAMHAQSKLVRLHSASTLESGQVTWRNHPMQHGAIATAPAGGTRTTRRRCQS